MKGSDFNQSVTPTVIIKEHVRKDGTSLIYLRMVIDRKKKEFNLNESWLQQFFSKERECVLPRYPKDPETDRVNLVINEAKGRANKIKLRYFADSRKLTLEVFEREFINYMSGDNFLLFWKTKQQALLLEKIITEETSVNHTTNYNRLAEFVADGEFLQFCDINLNLVERYNAWLRKKKKLSHNSACSAHKCFKTYLNHALDEKYKFDYPYNRFKFSFRDGERDVLEDEELDRLKDLYSDKRLDALAREILAKFIFSCYTGIRISDSGLVTSDMVRAGKLFFDLKKGFNSGKKVNILLPAFALQLIAGRTGLLFEKVADATCNRYLKAIALMANVDKKLTFHVSRDTFGTHFIAMGGDVYTLMLLMGHSDIRTTMIYIKLSEKRQDQQMKNFDRRDQAKMKLL